jgi:hypothetical protein
MFCYLLDTMRNFEIDTEKYKHLNIDVVIYLRG